MYQRGFKRILDFLTALLCLIVLAVPMLLIALAVKLDSPGPVLFWQKRIGIRKTTYMMPKFRSMYTTAPAEMATHLLDDPEQWITPVGSVLRRYSLDELPQFISILKGDMSFIGPRPALWNQFDLIEERDKYGANDVIPGLSGWAQINGRDELPIPVKAAYDGEYARNVSFAFDLKCFFGTIKKVLRHEGVVEGSAVAETDAERELIEK